VCRIADPIFRSEQLKLPKQAKTSSKQGAGRLVSREREETLTLLLLSPSSLVAAMMMMMMKVLWALCSAFVLCLGLLRLRNTEGKGKAGWRLYERSVQVSKTNVYRSLQYHTCLQYHSSPQIRNRVHWIGSWHHPVGWLARKSIGTQQVNWHGACTRPPTLISSRPVLICSVESTTKHSAYRR
jgi:hypothetical protein